MGRKRGREVYSLTPNPAYLPANQRWIADFNLKSAKAPKPGIVEVQPAPEYQANNFTVFGFNAFADTWADPGATREAPGGAQNARWNGGTTGQPGQSGPEPRGGGGGGGGDGGGPGGGFGPTPFGPGSSWNNRAAAQTQTQPFSPLGSPVRQPMGAPPDRLASTARVLPLDVAPPRLSLEVQDAEIASLRQRLVSQQNVLGTMTTPAGASPLEMQMTAALREDMEAVVAALESDLQIAIEKRRIAGEALNDKGKGPAGPSDDRAILQQRVDDLQAAIRQLERDKREAQEENARKTRHIDEVIEERTAQMERSHGNTVKGLEAKRQREVDQLQIRLEQFNKKAEEARKRVKDLEDRLGVPSGQPPAPRLVLRPPAPPGSPSSSSSSDYGLGDIFADQPEHDKDIQPNPDLQPAEMVQLIAELEEAHRQADEARATSNELERMLGRVMEENNEDTNALNVVRTRLALKESQLNEALALQNAERELSEQERGQLRGSINSLMADIEVMKERLANEIESREELAERMYTEAMRREALLRDAALAERTDMQETLAQTQFYLEATQAELAAANEGGHPDGVATQPVPSPQQTAQAAADFIAGELPRDMITLEPTHDPVQLLNGSYHDRTTVERHFADLRQMGRPFTDPVTRDPVPGLVIAGNTIRRLYRNARRDAGQDVSDDEGREIRSPRYTARGQQLNRAAATYILGPENALVPFDVDLMAPGFSFSQLSPEVQQDIQAERERRRLAEEERVREQEFINQQIAERVQRNRAARAAGLPLPFPDLPLEDSDTEREPVPAPGGPIPLPNVSSGSDSEPETMLGIRRRPQPEPVLAIHRSTGEERDLYNLSDYEDRLDDNPRINWRTTRQDRRLAQQDLNNWRTIYATGPLGRQRLANARLILGRPMSHYLPYPNNMDRRQFM